MEILKMLGTRFLIGSTSFFMAFSTAHAASEDTRPFPWPKPPTTQPTKPDTFDVNQGSSDEPPFRFQKVYERPVEVVLKRSVYLRPKPSSTWSEGESCGSLDKGASLVMDAYGVSPETGKGWTRVGVTSDVETAFTNRKCGHLNHVFVPSEHLRFR